MCGIAGFEAADAAEAARSVEAAIGCLATRGPDGSGSETVSRWTLAQTRLAVIDLSDRVRYPMANERGDVFLVFNGEIYNHVELRRELQRSGHVFATDCDAEVVVHGYEEWGSDVFARLNGMWALAIVDGRRDELVLSRDPFGVKPLVRTTGKRFAFASDAMALVRTGYSSGEIDAHAIDEYLAFQYVPPPRTGLADVSQIEPGTVVVRGADGRETVRRFASPVFDRPPPTEDVSLEETDSVLRAAVARQVRADVDVGIFLSGGIDSALLLSYAVSEGLRPTAITIGFAGFGEYDESAAAGQLATALGVEHVVETFRAPTFETTIDGVANAYDVPLGDPSAIATLMLSKVAREYVTVALSGTGGDDLFGGYYRHRAHHVHRLVRRTPAWMRDRVAALPVDRGGERASTPSLLRSYAARLARAGGMGPAEQYVELISNSMSARSADALRRPVDHAAVAAATAAARELDCDAGILDGLQSFELRTYVPGDLLLKEDRATMAHSLEGRVPFLDQEVAALAARTPARQRATMSKGKVLLRELADRRLPASSAGGGKRGFAVPLRPLVDGPWRDPMQDWLHGATSSLVDPAALRHLLSTRAITALDAWVMVVLIAWEQRVADERRRAIG
jgi:asparagine synthase (glutamine-hydrolysing)